MEIHATAFLNLLRNEWLRRLPVLGELGLVLLVGLGFGVGLVSVRPWAAAMLAVLGTLLLVLVAWWLFTVHRLWFAWLVVVIQIALALGWAVVFNSLQAYVEKRVLEHSLGLHLSPRRVRQILKRPELLHPGAEKQELSIMFTDIADFSTISDRTLPDKLFQHLNRYFEETIGCVQASDGTVVKLIGDAIFAVWNAPEPQPNHQSLACRAALALREKLVRFDAASESLPMHTRVGLHAGVACVGNCGSAERFDYTAIGANINLASRLEGLNKHLGTDILASEEIIAAVEKEFVSRPVGQFRLKGCDRVVGVHELIGNAAVRESTAPWREAFTVALRKFQRAEFDEAEAGFRKVIELRGKDGPAKFYLDLVADHRAAPPGKGWFGEVNMEEK